MCKPSTDSISDANFSILDLFAHPLQFAIPYALNKAKVRAANEERSWRRTIPGEGALGPTALSNPHWPALAAREPAHKLLEINVPDGQGCPDCGKIATHIRMANVGAPSMTAHQIRSDRGWRGASPAAAETR